MVVYMGRVTSKKKQGQLKDNKHPSDRAQLRWKEKIFKMYQYMEFYMTTTEN